MNAAPTLSHCAGRTVRVSLTDGTWFEGRLLGVHDSGLEVTDVVQRHVEDMFPGIDLKTDTALQFYPWRQVRRVVVDREGER